MNTFLFINKGILCIMYPTRRVYSDSAYVSHDRLEWYFISALL